MSSRRPALFALSLALSPLALAGCATTPATRPAAAAPGVVSAADPRAAAAGVEILRMGGNATDAAIATMLALNVVEPQNSGVGGGSFLLRHDGRSGQVTSLDGRETAPSAAKADWFLGPDGKPLPKAYMGGRSAGVPGNVALMAAAHRQSGRLAWGKLFEPAIRMAEQGIVVSPRLHNGLNLYGRHVTGDARALYFNTDGSAIGTGTTLRQPALAQSLRLIARDRGRDFHHGKTAKAIVTALNTAEVNASAMTAADLAGYTVEARDPVCGTYRAYRICGMGPPSSGGITVLAILKQIERFDIAAMGRESPVAWGLFADSMRLAYADRDTYIADPAFVQVPVSGLIDPAYIAQRSALLTPGKALAVVEPGQPAGAPPRLRPPHKDDPGTSALAVVDGEGNVVQVTTTINGYFGSGIGVGGMMLNNELPDFDMVPVKDGFLVANRVEGGKRPRSSMSPTIVYGPDGKVRLVIGAAGGATIIAQVAKAIMGVVDWNLSAQDAIAMGLIFAPTKDGVVERDTELEALLPALTAMGQSLRIGPLGLKANAIEWTGGRWVGAADPRSEGVAMDTAGAVTTIRRRANDLNGAHE